MQSTHTENEVERCKRNWEALGILFKVHCRNYDVLCACMFVCVRYRVVNKSWNNNTTIMMPLAKEVARRPVRYNVVSCACLCIAYTYTCSIRYKIPSIGWLPLLVLSALFNCSIIFYTKRPSENPTKTLTVENDERETTYKVLVVC